MDVDRLNAAHLFNESLSASYTMWISVFPLEYLDC